MGKFKTKKNNENQKIDDTQKIKIGIHVRKGDQAGTVCDVCGKNYYNRAIKEIIKQNKLNISNVEKIQLGDKNVYEFTFENGRTERIEVN